MYSSVLISSAINEQLGYFWFGAIRNIVAMDILLWIYIFISFGSVSMGGTAGSQNIWLL